MKLEINTQTSDAGEARVSVRGTITIHTSPDLRRALQPLFGGSCKTIRVDLQEVGFIDSSGIATLVEGLKWARENDGRFVLVGLSEKVRDVFELAKLDTVFEIETPA